MDSFLPLLSWRTLPVAAFEQLRSLVGQTAQANSPEAVVLTETAIARPTPPFMLGVSAQFCALVLCKSNPETAFTSEPNSNEIQTEIQNEIQNDPQTESIEVGLSFEPETLQAFLHDRPFVRADRDRAQRLLDRTQPQRQSQFALDLAQLLSQPPAAPAQRDRANVCQPVEAALDRQRTREQLLNQVILETSHNAPLAVLLGETIDRARHFLNLDRLAVYQFDDYSQHRELPPIAPPPRDCITYESRHHARHPSLLSLDALDDWAVLSRARDRYQPGESLALNDCDALDHRDALQAVLTRWQVQAQVIVPVFVCDRLWGLLLAHQCDRPRTWQPRERELLEHIAARLSVAIDRAQLYAEVQQQKETLEQRVDSRTRELRDALAAAQAASKTRDDFLATISHELRTPLTCIIGMSSTLLRWSFGHLTPKQREYIQTIYNSGEHLMELINDLLDLSQIESGTTALSLSDFSLSQLAHQMFRMMVDRATVNGVHLGLDLQIDRHEDRLYADRDRLRQILFNLLSNAIKFTATGGQAILRIYRTSESAVFEVADTGIGIPKEQRSILFETFRQLESTYTRQYGGTGLGLALTKQLVELHGGTIEVESQVGVGSTFTVRLPLQAPLLDAEDAEGEDAPPQAELLPSTSPKGHVVLIADREEESTLICDLLTAAGYHAIWMLEGSTALKQIELLQPIAAIVDRQLSSMDGCELTSILRQLPNTQSLKILLMTEAGNPEILQRCRESGANECLPRPIEPEQLLDTIVELLRET